MSEKASVEDLQRRAAEKRAELRRALLDAGAPERVCLSAFAKQLGQDAWGAWALECLWPAGPGGELPAEEALLQGLKIAPPSWGGELPAEEALLQGLKIAPPSWGGGLPVEVLQGLKIGGPRSRGALESIGKAVAAAEAAAAAAAEAAAAAAEVSIAEAPKKLARERARRIRGERSPLARVNEALVERVYRGELDGGALCSEGDARRLPLFRGCALGTPAEAARLFAWVEGGSWDRQRRASWMRYSFGVVQWEDVHEEEGEEQAPLTGLFETSRSRLSLSGNLIGLAEAEVLFIGEGSEPPLILEQLSLALRVWRPWTIVFVLEEEGGGREWQREILLGVRDLIDDEIAQIKFWRFTWKEEVAGVLDRELWPLALEKGEAAGRRELLSVDAMVPVPPGRFWMGSEVGVGSHDERPRHEVTISEGFWMSQTPVTQGLYALVMGKNPAKFKGATRPVEEVSWFDAVRFCNRLSELAGLEPVYWIGEGDEDFGEDSEPPPVSRREWAAGFQLPTEAEWEYAAKAGGGLLYAGSDELDEVAWYAGNADMQTHPVGQKRPTASALYGLSGNVGEWCFDAPAAYRERKRGITDPVSTDLGAYERGHRGGQYRTEANYCHVASRYECHPGWRFDFLGLRLLRRSRS